MIRRYPHRVPPSLTFRPPSLPRLSPTSLVSGACTARHVQRRGCCVLLTTAKCQGQSEDESALCHPQTLPRPPVSLLQSLADSSKLILLRPASCSYPSLHGDICSRHAAARQQFMLPCPALYMHFDASDIHPVCQRWRVTAQNMLCPTPVQPIPRVPASLLLQAYRCGTQALSRKCEM
jgi:hypothetical protein